MSFDGLGLGTGVRHTLDTLKTDLQPKQHYEVKVGQHSESRLVIVENKTFFDKVKYHFQKDKKNEQVKQFISGNVVKLANKLTQEQANVTDDVKDEVRDLFFNRLALLPEDLFDRRVLGTLTDKKQLPEMLNPNLAETKNKFEEGTQEETERKLERRIEKVRLGQALGVGLKPISLGASGSYFARDHKMKIVGVFKPGQEESGGVNTPKMGIRIKNIFVKNILGIDLQGSFWPAEGYLSEALTSTLAQHLSVDVVPRSKVTTMMSDRFASAKKAKGETKEVGSFQIFADKTKSADEYFGLNTEKSKISNAFLKLKVWRHKDEISKTVSREDFEQMAVIDGLIANRDRHFENWLVKEDANADGTHKIALIDHQLAFPKVNPPKSDSFYRRNQNKWAGLPQAGKKFSRATRENIPPGLKGENLKDLLDALQASSSAVDEGDEVKRFRDPVLNDAGEDTGESQEFAFKQRVAVLLIALDKGISIREYAGIKSIEEMVQFASKNDLDITTPLELDHYLELI